MSSGQAMEVNAHRKDPACEINDCSIGFPNQITCVVQFVKCKKRKLIFP